MPAALALVSISALIMDHVIAFAPPLRALEAFWPTRALKLFLAWLLRPKRLAQWAGLKVTAKDDVWLEVRPASTEVCQRRGSKKAPRFVRGRTPGLCAVRVTVVRPSGSKKESVAYVSVG